MSSENLPLLLPKDVSPESPFFLRGSARYVVGHPDADGLVVIRSQHSAQQPAERSRQTLARATGGFCELQVYRTRRANA